MSVSNNMTSSCNIGCSLISNTSLSIKNLESKILLSDNFKDDFSWVQPGSATALGILTGITLMVASPITIPIAIDLECDSLRQEISDSNDRVASKIAEKIKNASRIGGELSESKEQFSIRLEKLKELHNKGLITKDDFEKKQKEILNSL